MARLNWRSWSLSIKLTVAMTMIVVVGVFSITFLSIRREQQTFRAEMERQASVVLTLLQPTLEDELYFLDVDDILVILQDMVQGELNFVSARVYDGEGRIIADAFQEDRTIQSGPNPLGMQLLQSDEVMLEWQADQLLAGQAIQAGPQTLGAVSMGLSTAPLEASINAMRNQGVGVAIVAVLLGSLLALFLSRSITGPLQELAAATQRLAAGDLTQEISVESEDEVGILGRGMEHMRVELASLYQNLEQQVAERTRELMVARDQALEASRFKSELLAKSSHELRTPLNAILGNAEMLDEEIYGPLNQNQQTLTRKIIRSTHSLTDMVSELLDQASLEAGKLELHIRPFPPTVLAHEVQAKLEVLAENEGLTLTTQVDADVPQTVTGDPTRIEQILINLVGNAVKFTEEGEVHVRIYQPNATHWAIAVSDTGIGIPPEARPHIFEPFHQVDGTATRSHGGTGLGLSIVKELVNLMAGEITVESAVGEGSTFTVHLPLGLQIE